MKALQRAQVELALDFDRRFQNSDPGTRNRVRGLTSNEPGVMALSLFPILEEKIRDGKGSSLLEGLELVHKINFRSFCEGDIGEDEFIKRSQILAALIRAQLM